MLVRKYWLYSFLFYFAFTAINSVRLIIISQLPAESASSAIFFNLLLAFCLYYTSYKKPGTKVLTTLLIAMPIINISSFILLSILNKPLQLDTWTIVGYLFLLAFYIMCWKLRRLNKQVTQGTV